MNKFVPFESRLVPLAIDNIDTDQIIPARFLKTISKDGLGDQLFYDWRYDAEGNPKPDFILNTPDAKRSHILLAGDNFGCGSSREPAVWALMGLGIRAIIAPSFGDIFYNNCFQNGVLPIILPEDTVRAIASEVEAAPEAPMTVDLENCIITNARELRVPFSIDEARRRALLEGLDEIGMTLKREARIAAWQDSDRIRRPWVYI